MVLNTMNDLKKIFDESAEFLKTQWYRRHEALKYELEDLKRVLDVFGQYDDEFTFDEMKTYKKYEAEYNELLEEYEVGVEAC